MSDTPLDADLNAAAAAALKALGAVGGIVIFPDDDQSFSAHVVKSPDLEDSTLVGVLSLTVEGVKNDVLNGVDQWSVVEP